MPTLQTTSTLLALVITAIAAVTDARHGRIPNGLTLPPLLGMPLAQLALAGPGAAAERVVSALVCALIPLFLFWKRAMGGGDVKLFAAMGALLPVMTALEAQYAAYICVAALALLQLALRGQLLTTLCSTGRLAARALGRKCDADEAPPHTMRMGPGIFVATAGVLALQVLP